MNTSNFYDLYLCTCPFETCILYNVLTNGDNINTEMSGGSKYNVPLNTQFDFSDAKSDYIQQVYYLYTASLEESGTGHLPVASLIQFGLISACNRQLSTKLKEKSAHCDKNWIKRTAKFEKFDWTEIRKMAKNGEKKWLLSPVMLHNIDVITFQCCK